MSDEALLLDMNRLRDQIREAKEGGLIDYQALSLAIGKNQTYIQQFVTKGSPRIMHAHLFEAVKAHLAAAQKAGALSKPARKVSGDEAFALLERLDIIPPGQGRRAYEVLKSVWAADAEIS